MKIVDRIARQSAPTLVRVACVLALVGLGSMVVSVILPRPLIVIGAMSIGHGLGIGAFACYLLAVLLDTARRDRVGQDPNSAAPSPGRASERRSD